MSSWRLFTGSHDGGVHGGAMVIKTTIIPKAILFTI
jgi:hypothetical protein